MDYDSKPDTIMVCVALLESVLYGYGKKKKTQYNLISKTNNLIYYV